MVKEIGSKKVNQHCGNCMDTELSITEYPCNQCISDTDGFGHWRPIESWSKSKYRSVS